MKALILHLYILLSVLFLIFPPYTHASEKPFDIETTATYTVLESGITSVEQDVRIRNNTEFMYTPTYNFTIGLTDLANIKIGDKQGALPFTVHEKDTITTLEISFPKRVVGIHKVNQFTIIFETKSIARKNGKVWQVYLPGLSDPNAFSSYEIYVNAPEVFGHPSIVKPFKEFEKGTRTYYFRKNEIGKGGVALIFGEEQVYEYNLLYHLQNPNLFPIRTEIALPPNTSYQDSSIVSIEPEPENVVADANGNWLASYHLNAQQKLDIKVTGQVKVFPTPRSSELTPSERSLYTSPQPYWEVRHPQIKSIAQEITTPEGVYNYVVKTLQYDYKGASDKDTRLGAASVLSHPSRAVCLEFTDLFVALARAVGIPSRSVEGYAFTQDSIRRPTSPNGDILHAWPEYYDEVKKAWVMVDPTWGNTTFGLDFFNTFDVDHVAFVIKGEDSKYPIPAGGYKKDEKSKDVDVKFATNDEFDDNEKLIFSSKLPNVIMAGLPIAGDIIVQNTGKKAIDSKTLTIKSSITPEIYTYEVKNIPPFGKKSVPVVFWGVPFLTMSEIKLTMLVDNTQKEAIIKAQLLPDQKTGMVLGGIASGITIIITFIAFKIRSLHLQR